MIGMLVAYNLVIYNMTAFQAWVTMKETPET